VAVFRVNKTKDFTVMSNYHLKDKELSLKAKGLLSQMLSLPDSWDYSIEGLVSINKESRGAIQSTLKELEDGGYLVRERLQNEKGQFEYVYNIFENPQTDKPQTENPYTVKRFTENPQTENPTQLNTDLSITNKSNTNELSIENKRVTAKRFTPPTVDKDSKPTTKAEKKAQELDNFYQRAKAWAEAD